MKVKAGTKGLILLRRMSLSYRKQSTDLLCKSMDWLIYNRDLRHQKVKELSQNFAFNIKRINKYLLPLKPSENVWRRFLSYKFLRTFLDKASLERRGMSLINGNY